MNSLRNVKLAGMYKSQQKEQALRSEIHGLKMDIEIKDMKIRYLHQLLYDIAKI